MDYKARITFFYLIAAFSLMVLTPSSLQAQNDSYHFTPAPDIWYNDVDGIRLGVRVLGEMEGSFKDGPHRLDAGFWLGTKFPDLPVSYYLSFTEPIPPLSNFGEEFSVQAISSVRAGYSQHALALNKRFQKGFDELRYQEISISLSQEKAFDQEYRLKEYWEDDWKTLLGIDIQTQGFTPLGILETNFSFKQNLNAVSGNFSVVKAEIRHMMDMGKGFGLNLRTFAGLSSSDAPSEYFHSRASRAPIDWLSNGVTRARGTIPESFFEKGFMQIAGGMNLRGYQLDAYRSAITDPNYILSYRGIYNRTLSLNSEILFPNFINSLLKESIVGDFVHLKSYVFHDVGAFSGDNIYFTDVAEDFTEVSADAGIGFQFSVNIPDYLGKDRGFAIRYDMPFWLSDPAGMREGYAPGEEPDKIQFRGVLGIGAVISF